MMDLSERVAFAGGIDALVLRSKPVPPDGLLAKQGVEGVFWFNGRQGFNPFGRLTFSFRADAEAFLDALREEVSGAGPPGVSGGT